MTILRAFVVLVLLAAVPALSARADDRLVVAMARGSPASSMVVAQEIGAFKKHGLDVHIIELPSAAEISVALASGDAQIGATAFSAAFFNLAGKSALRVIAGTSRLNPEFNAIAYVAGAKAYDAGVHHPHDLAGKTIGITTVGSPLHYALLLLAKKYGFDPDGMRMVQLRGMGPAAAALKGGQIDATLLSAPLAAKVEKAGDGHVIGWVDSETPFQLGGILVTLKMIEQQRPLLERFIQAYLEGAKAYGEAFLRLDASAKPMRGKDYDRFVDVFAKRQGISRDAVEEGLSYWDPEGRLDVQSVYDQIGVWKSLGLVDAAVDPAAVVDLSFVRGHLNVPKK